MPALFAADTELENVELTAGTGANTEATDLRVPQNPVFERINGALGDLPLHRQPFRQPSGIIVAAR
jgi:hypothetical protein